MWFSNRDGFCTDVRHQATGFNWFGFSVRSKELFVLTFP
jgi:hypothetical protein